MVSITNTLLAHSVWRNNMSDADPAMAPVNISKLMTLDGDTSAQLNYLSRLILGKPMSEGLKKQSLYLINERQNANAQIRAEELLFLFVSSPEAAVQR